MCIHSQWPEPFSKVSPTVALIHLISRYLLLGLYPLLLFYSHVLICFVTLLPVKQKALMRNGSTTIGQIAAVMGSGHASLSLGATPWLKKRANIAATTRTVVTRSVRELGYNSNEIDSINYKYSTSHQ
ncbi:hypothetical protein F4779DRAFT_603194 [Xylariaceae sp. FL0662B]|nr:hypothetical protein F4779DRAFT_603194 [Xylariaceae sp. FL0662B]